MAKDKKKGSEAKKAKKVVINLENLYPSLPLQVPLHEILCTIIDRTFHVG